MTEKKPNKSNKLSHLHISLQFCLCLFTSMPHILADHHLFIYDNKDNTGSGNLVTIFEKGTTEDSAGGKVRKFFPETWLFMAVFVGPEGHTTVTKTAPDTITTWLTSAFSVHPHYGLSVLPKPAELVTFRNTFVSVDLPYSAIRNEEVCLKAFAFNYYDKPLHMRVSFLANEKVHSIRVISDKNGYKRLDDDKPQRITHRLGEVDSNEVADTIFCFIPTTLGQVALKLHLHCNSLPLDSVERMLLVEPEGTPQVQTHPVILNVSTKEELRYEVPITFPNDTVNGSERITVAVATDLLGPVFDGLEDLLRMPYGCGEQNMLYFAPNVFLIDYLQRTKTYTPEVAEKAENYMMVGYQKELKYKHEDGSYSAFGQRNTTQSGSMWLTAFVIKCFAQSMALDNPVIDVDLNSFHESVTWMITKQAKNGTFPEPGKVFNKNMQGGSATGEALTAYVLIALAETNRSLGEHMGDNKKSLDRAIIRGRQYLEKQLGNLTDCYDLAIVTYVLHLTHSSHADHAFSLLKAKAIPESLTLHWERKNKKKPKYYYSWLRTTEAINIEMTAYSLLTYLLKGDVPGALPIVRWLTSQRGPQGGFISTQDTVLALQGLASIAADIYQPTFTPISLTVQWSNKMGLMENKTVVLDDKSKLLLHKVELPIEKNNAHGNVTIYAKTLNNAGAFRGFAVAEVIQDYNVLVNTSSDVYDLNVYAEVKDDKNFILHVKASCKDMERCGMTLIEVEVPTGYAVEEEDIEWEVSKASMFQQDGNKFVLYYDELTDNPVVIRLPMTELHGSTTKHQLNNVKIYDYYETSTQMVVNYFLGQTDDICRKQPDFEACRFA